MKTYKKTKEIERFFEMIHQYVIQIMLNKIDICFHLLFDMNFRTIKMKYFFKWQKNKYLHTSKHLIFVSFYVVKYFDFCVQIQIRIFINISIKNRKNQIIRIFVKVKQKRLSFNFSIQDFSFSIVNIWFIIISFFFFSSFSSSSFFSSFLWLISLRASKFCADFENFVLRARRLIFENKDSCSFLFRKRAMTKVTKVTKSIWKEFFSSKRRLSNENILKNKLRRKIWMKLNVMKESSNCERNLIKKIWKLLKLKINWNATKIQIES